MKDKGWGEKCADYNIQRWTHSPKFFSSPISDGIVPLSPMPWRCRLTVEQAEREKSHEIAVTNQGGSQNAHEQRRLNSPILANWPTAVGMLPRNLLPVPSSFPRFKLCRVFMPKIPEGMEPLILLSRILRSLIFAIIEISDGSVPLILFCSMCIKSEKETIATTSAWAEMFDAQQGWEAISRSMPYPSQSVGLFRMELYRVSCCREDSVSLCGSKGTDTLVPKDV